jgi:tape measure domain-containing protein
VAEIDPVILEIRAQMNAYKVELKNSTALATSNFARQERAILDLERQIKASSGRISGTLRGLAGSLAGAISTQQLAGIIDSYTRFQNQLRVAGIEGERLALVQERLFGIAQKYGVELEAIGTLYGRSAAAAKELGLNQQQQATITEATAAALKITGATAESASGALLQLSQALGGSKIQAEEYNSLIDALRPLLQAVASGSDKWAGSVAKLTADVKKSNVTTKEFVDALLKGAPQVIEQASEATLTLSGAFTKLTNALTVYIGQSAEANGVTQAIAGGMDLLAGNLDTIVDALAVVAAILLGRFVAGLAASTVAAIATAAATAGVTTALGTLGVAARLAGTSLLAAFGGPVGIAVAALAIGIGVLTTRTGEAAQAARINAKAQEIVGDTSKRATDAIDKLANAHGKARAEALKAAKAEFENTKQKLASAQASLLLATAEYASAKAAANREDALSGAFNTGTVGSARDRSANQRFEQVQESIRAQEQAVGTLMAALAQQQANLSAPESALSSIADDGKKKKGRHGRSPAEIAAEVADKLGQLGEEQIRAQLDITTDAEKRAELQGALYELEYKNRIAEINAAKDYSDAQKARLRAAVNAIYGRDSNGNLTSASPQGITINRELERAQRDQAERALQLQREALEAEAALVDDRRTRLALERRILDLSQQEETSRLETAIAAGEIADATAARAALARKQDAERAGLDRQFESPGQAYRREIFRDINDQIEDIEVDGLRKLSDELTNATKKALGLKGALGDLVGELIRIGIERQIIGPLADELFGAAAGGSGGGGGFIKKLFGRASGGYVGPGQTVRVNENRGGMELLRMGSQGGTIIPLGQTAAVAPRGGVTIIHAPQTVFKNAITTRELMAEVDRRNRESIAQAAPLIADAGARKAVLESGPGFQRRGTYR